MEAQGKSETAWNLSSPFFPFPKFWPWAEFRREPPISQVPRREHLLGCCWPGLGLGPPMAPCGLCYEDQTHPVQQILPIFRGRSHVGGLAWPSSPPWPWGSTGPLITPCFSWQLTFQLLLQSFLILPSPTCHSSKAVSYNSAIRYYFL